MDQKSCLRSLNKRPTFLGLEIEDWILSGGVFALGVVFECRLPGAMVAIATAVSLQVLKYKKLPGYLKDAVRFYVSPKRFDVLAQDEAPILPLIKLF